MTVVVAPEGVFELARNVPPQDTQLLAATTCLVAHEAVQPALVPMLLSGVENTRQQSSSFISANEFPSSEHVTLPLAPVHNAIFVRARSGYPNIFPTALSGFSIMLASSYCLC